MEQIYYNKDEVQEWRIDSRIRGEGWLLIISAILLSLILHWAAPVKTEPTPITPKVAEMLGLCSEKGQ